MIIQAQPGNNIMRRIKGIEAQLRDAACHWLILSVEKLWQRDWPGSGLLVFTSRIACFQQIVAGNNADNATVSSGDNRDTAASGLKDNVSYHADWRIRLDMRLGKIRKSFVQRGISP